MLKSNWHAIIFGLIALLTSCSAPQSRIAEGNWRGVFSENGKEIPFNFTISYLGSSPVLTYRNASDHFVADSVIVSGDTLIFPVEVYDSRLTVIRDSNKLSGYWSRNSDSDRKLSFEAHPDEEFRFWIPEEITSSEFDPTGKWNVNLINADSSITPAVAEFKNESGRVTGTILTTTGDYRFLEGQIKDGKLKLSSFSGGAASLLDLQFEGKDSLSGSFGGIFATRKFFGKRDSQAAPPDAYSLTFLKEGYETLDFSFPDLSGNPVSLSDDKYKGKVKIVTIMGTWCPNCMDESAFLGPWYEENKDRGVEVIALSFEQKDDLAFAQSRFEKFSKRFGVTYDVLFAGKADKKAAAEKLPALNQVWSFPTTVFIDKAGKVRKIHTGFAGPATGVHFEQFKEEFNSLVDQLVAEG
ncbi:Peroxiredoxin [Algoriphagus alkaliphilus]|uniref:Peroxiredoxin n=1 Tax=Algoriphagus alkaliphilus TaxID=279824 RepID=A0A1G5VER4_9BACT|nr:Peroxiredoxin [Algoriphagus alkaliphilus]